VSDLVAAFRRCRVLDASPTIAPGMPVFPGHPEVRVDAARTHSRDGYFLQELTLGEHTGTHVDAPAHADPGRPEATIDTFPAARFVVPYVLADLAPLGLGPGGLATAAHVAVAVAEAGGPPEAGDALLLHFGWDVHRDGPPGWWAGNTPGLDAGACELIAGWRVGLVGSDTATCDSAAVEGAIVADHGHRTWFLPHDILLVEGLQGLGTAPRRGLIVAAPLKVRGGSGAPARVLLLAEASS
jgi:kynurenine formamidase